MKPDILVEYPPAESFPSGAGAGSYAVAYVRPETNTVLYARAIAAASSRCAAWFSGSVASSCRQCSAAAA